MWWEPTDLCRDENGGFTDENHVAGFDQLAADVVVVEVDYCELRYVALAQEAQDLYGGVWAKPDSDMVHEGIEVREGRFWWGSDHN